MADKRLTELDALASIGDDDILYVVDDPTGVPQAKKITFANLSAMLMRKASNLSDVASAATAFSNIKQAATESATGVAELATVAEALAGTDTSRIVTPAGLAYALAPRVVPKQPSQGLYSTPASATGIQVSDNDNLDMGTNSFTLHWEGILPDWTPSDYVFLLTKTTVGVDGFLVYLSTSDGHLYFQILSTPYFSSTSLGVADKTAHKITIVLTRETSSVAGSLVFFLDGIQVGGARSLPAGVPVSLSNAATFNVLSNHSSTSRYAGTAFAVYLFNRALSASEVLDLCRNGVSYADRWGSQTAKYTSDFSGGVDGWGGVASAVVGNIDGIGGLDDWFRVTIDNTSGAHYASRSTSIPYPLRRYRVTFKYFIPSTNSDLNAIGFWHSNGVIEPGCAVFNVLDAATDASFEFASAPTGAVLYFAAYKGTAYSFQDSGGNDVFYIKNIVLTEIGAVLALEPEGIQPSPGQWLDSSSNKLHALQPASGTGPIRRLKTFELRDTLSWSGTHEAKYIGGNQNVLPANCYIENIIGVISGATIEDIIIGDGSDTDRWVAATTGLATGTIAFTPANRISDGTNYKMVVDPDANFTGSIAFTITGRILQ